MKPKAKRKKGYIAMFILSIVLTLLGVATILPDANASTESFIGYKAHCSFAPISTFILFIFAGLNCMVRNRYFSL